jgi:hypothetical protein
VIAVRSLNSRAFVTAGCGFAAALAMSVCITPAVASAAKFEITNFTMAATNVAGEPYTQAGGYPYEVASVFSIKAQTDSVTGVLEPVQDAKDAAVDVPDGLIGDPQATERCGRSQFFNVLAEGCPAGTQVGFSKIQIGGALLEGGVYNLVPEPGSPGELGLQTHNGLAFVLRGGIRTGEGYGLVVSDLGIPQAEVYSIEIRLWGVPAEHRHDQLRGLLCGRLMQNGAPGAQECVPGHAGGERAIGPLKPFLRMPTDCRDGQLRAVVHADSWQEPVAGFPFGAVEESVLMPAPTGCGALAFEPSLEVRPESGGATFSSRVGEPVGLHVALNVPQQHSVLKEKPATPAGAEPTGTSDVKNVTVALPVGMVVSPSSANGLLACSDAQFALHSPAAGACPPASQVGTVRVSTPLLALPLAGEVYLAEPQCGPCSGADAQDGRMVRLFVQAIATDGSGVVVKLEGAGSINQQTGQITTTFKENPQLPFSRFELSLEGGPRATLANPSTCGLATTRADLTPWSTPFTPDATPSSSYEVTGCSAPQFSPSFTAGTTSNQAGGFSPLTLAFGRTDADEFLSGLSLRMPPGLLGMLSKVTLCKEPQASQGTCAPESLIGHTQVLTGPGAEPFLVTGGQVFLTEGYKGAPYGLSIVVPAKAGPYTLSGTTGTGMVVVRAAINVDPHTAALTVTSDPLPTELDGIPLQLKVVNVTIDRPGFTFNPTSCEKQAIDGTLSSVQGKAVAVSSPFQVTNCAALAFKPSFKVSTSGKTSRKNGASLDVKLTYPKDALGRDANIAKVKVDLPKQLPSWLTTLQQACPDTTFAANPAACSSGSVVGIARASTPVLPVGLIGPVYFVSHGGAKFPELVVVLQGDGVRVDLAGETFISKAGITSSTFSSVPDVPVSSFELYLPQGPHHALAANGNLCKSKLKMPTAFVAQDGAVIHQSTTIAVTGCPKAKKARASRARHDKPARSSSRTHSNAHRGGRS